MQGAKLSVAVLAMAVLAVAGAVIVWIGLDQPMILGAGVGLVLGFSLTLLGGRGLSRALSGTKGGLAAQLLGGLLIRLAMLLCGFAVCVVTGVGNPIGFALAYLAGALLAQVRQVWAFSGGPKSAAM